MVYERYVGIVFFGDEHEIYGYEESTFFETYGEAVGFINKCSDNQSFLYGTVEKRFTTGEAQQSNPLDEIIAKEMRAMGIELGEEN